MLFLAWQDPVSRAWFPIGRLSSDGTTYQFVYTQGVKVAQQQCAFQPLPSFQTSTWCTFRQNCFHYSLTAFYVEADRTTPISYSG